MARRQRIRMEPGDPKHILIAKNLAAVIRKLNGNSITDEKRRRLVREQMRLEAQMRYFSNDHHESGRKPALSDYMGVTGASEQASVPA